MMLIQDLNDGLATTPFGQSTNTRVYYSEGKKYKAVISELPDTTQVLSICNVSDHRARPDDQDCKDILALLAGDNMAFGMEFPEHCQEFGARTWIIKILDLSGEK